jgi:hypothetical protein
MATITILTRALIPGDRLTPERVKIGIGSSDAALIQSNPNALNVIVGNWFGSINYLTNVNGFLYSNTSLPPYNNYWFIVEESGNWFVYFNINPLTYTSFLSYSDWTSFQFPYDLPPVDENYITLTQETDDITPIYNPVTFKFLSPKYDEIGYRYLVDIKGIDNSLIGRLKVVPMPDGSGYVDIQKILSNYVTKDFDADAPFINNCSNSFLNYKVEFGEEYLTSWEYTNLLKYVEPSSLFNGYTILNQANSGLTHTYVAGDQITIDTVTTGDTANINGLHDVVFVSATNQVVIDVPYVSTASTISVSGSTRYSDSRKTGYSALASTVDKMVWNGVMDWNEWKEYSETDYNITGTTGNYKLLSSIQPYSTGITNNEKYLFNKTQDYYFNYMVDTSLSATSFYLSVVDNLGNDYISVINSGSGYGRVRQFKLTYDDLITNGLSSNAEWVEFELATSGGTSYTTTYRLYIDNRCEINNTSILFMDKLGSVLSIPFQLKQNESIEVERETFNQQKYYDNRIALDLTNGGDTIYSMSSKKTYVLNTNWMNDRQMELFKIMMESPYIYIKLNNILYNCIIEDKSTEIEKYKNKVLFKKNVKVYISNQNPLNI